jgi:hypothetical protein
MGAPRDDLARERTSGTIRAEPRSYAGRGSRKQPTRAAEKERSVVDQQDERYLAAKARVEAKKGFFIHLAVYVVLNVIFLIVVGRDFLWATVFWGLGLAAHAAGVFLRDSRWLRDWEERAIQREIARQAVVEAGTTVTEPPPPPPAAAGTSPASGETTAPIDPNQTQPAPAKPTGARKSS